MSGTRMTNARWLGGIALTVFVAATAPGAARVASPPLATEGPWGTTLDLEVFDRLRGEFVRFFEPPATSATPNNRYDFLQNKFQLGLRLAREPYEAFFQFQHSTLAEVPANAVGVGATYRANTNRSLQNGAFLRSGWVRTWRLFGVDGLFVKAGRQLYSDGLDAPAADPTLRWLQQWRISQRLIGPFDYTAVGRSFDGGEVGWDGRWVNVTGFGFRPTYGGFEVDANRELDITLAGLSLNLKEAAGGLSPWLAHTIASLAVYYYRDVRVLDNRPLAARRATQGKPLRLYTVGAHAARVEPLGPGLVDGLAYGYGQGGDWQGQAQRAWAYGVEAGYRLPALWAAPWLRVGVNSASGDKNPRDDRHETFFQMLPTAWLYAQFPFYNMMNDQDVFAQAILDPHPRATVRADVHWLRVNASQDLVYAGGGATKNDFFGYSGLATAGHNEVAYLVNMLLTVRLTSFLSLNLLYAHAFGQGVIHANAAGTAGDYGFAETVLAF